MRKIPQIVEPVSGVWDAAVYFSVFLFSCQAAFSIHPVCPTKYTEPLFTPLANFAFLEHCWQFRVQLTFANLSLTVPLSLGKVKWSRLTMFPLAPLRFIFSLGLSLLAGLSQYLVKFNTHLQMLIIGVQLILLNICFFPFHQILEIRAGLLDIVSLNIFIKTVMGEDFEYTLLVYCHL